jgi:outer membrane translocation and assembly module TamA
VPIVPERHLIVFRGEAALTATHGDAQVPFFYLPRLGGTSSLRGYRHFRFYDRHSILLQAEYRWRPRRFVETAVFYDVGSVAPRVSRLGDRMLADYGAGVRFGTESRMFFRLEAAFGTPEGPKVYAKFSTEF